MEFKQYSIHTVTVYSAAAKGVVVELSDGSREFIHVSKLSDRYVADPVEYAVIGEAWKVAAVWSERCQKMELSHRISDIRLAESINQQQDGHVALANSLNTVQKAAPVSDNGKRQSTLDEMIESANRVLADKRRVKSDKTQYRRRRK